MGLTWFRRDQVAFNCMSD